MVEQHDPNNVVTNMLDDALETHETREKAYGGLAKINVFKATAEIFNAMSGKHLTPTDTALVLVAMKLARFGIGMEILNKLFQKDDELKKLIEKSVWDSALDGIVYIALAERERQKEEQCRKDANA